MLTLPGPADDTSRGVPVATVRAFLAAVFEVELDDLRWTVAPARHAATPPAFPDALAAVAVVSARNPRGRRGDRRRDDAAHRALGRTLAAAGLPPRPARGRSPDGTWVEESHAVAVTPSDPDPLPDLVALARRHAQAALALWTPGTLHTIWTPPDHPATTDTHPATTTTTPL